MSTPLSGPALLQRFLALDAFLLAHQALWRPKPFTQLHLSWENQHRPLADWLRARSLEQAEAEHNHPEQLAAPAPFPDLAQQASTLSAAGAPQRRCTGAQMATDRSLRQQPAI